MQSLATRDSGLQNGLSMKLQRLLHIGSLSGSLAFCASTGSLIAQPEQTARSFLVYVSRTSANFSLSPSEHLLIFHMPVQIPGASLPPGPYIFRLVAPSVVQVISATRSTIYGTFFALRTSGDGDTTRERIRFEQRPGDEFPRIVGWYLPGEIGYEFTYPKPKRKVEERVIER